MERMKEKGVVWFMTPLVLGNMLNPLNSTMLATAIVSICGYFKVNTGSGALLIVPLYLTSAIGQPLMGRLSDIFSAKQVNEAGFVLILISALIGVYAPTFSALIVSRILLGLGTSAAYPSSIAMIRQRYARLGLVVPGTALSLIAISSQVSLAFGPFLGGILTEHFGWRSIFFVNIPLVILAALISVFNKSEKEVTKKAKKLSSLDFPGLLAFSAFMVMFLITLLYPNDLWWKVTATIAALGLFIWIALRRSEPFIDVRLLAYNVAINMTFLRQIAITFVMYLTLYGLPQWLEQSKGIHPSSVGLMMLPLSLAAMIVSLLVSRTKRFIRLLLYGTLCVIGASAGLFLLNTQTSGVLIIGITILIGLSIGVLTIANQATLYEASPPYRTGISFGLYRTVGYIGAIFSTSQLKHEFRQGATDPGLHALAFYALIACVAIVVFLLPTLAYAKRKSPR